MDSTPEAVEAAKNLLDIIRCGLPGTLDGLVTAFLTAYSAEKDKTIAELEASVNGWKADALIGVQNRDYWKERAESAESALAEKDKTIAELRARVEEAEKSRDFTSDWYKERFDRMDSWMRNMAPCDIKNQYFSLQANGQRTPWDAPAYVETIHALKLQAKAAESALANLQGMFDNVVKEHSAYVKCYEEMVAGRAMDVHNLCARIDLFKAELAALRAPVEDVEVREALRYADAAADDVLNAYGLACKTLARALRPSRLLRE